MGGLGNNLFQLASTFGIARSKNMSVVVGTNTELNRTFKLNVDLRNDTSVCNSLGRRGEQFHCTYDPNLSKFNNTQNLRIGSYLQSWKYFYEFRNELRKQLTFRDNIQIEVNKTINKILEKFYVSSRGEVTLVGVHIRRGDMVNHSFGYNVATPEYLSKSVQYFQSKYKNIIFVIATLDKKWTQTHMPNNTIVEYLSHPKREFLVATLALCDHTITTVGSFGWWIGWLTGGEVTYFKWPAKEGSSLRKQFSKDYSDYFYPGWIGI
jgi:galactoside 2-L-fucosyltransferase 1/2